MGRPRAWNFVNITGIKLTRKRANAKYRSEVSGGNVGRSDFLGATAVAATNTCAMIH